MSSILSFNPDAFVAPGALDTPLPSPSLAPREWQHGLVLLADRRQPAEATPERWAQIVADAGRIVSAWGGEAAAAGWSIENLFGFDPAGGSFDYGLAVALRGGWLSGFDTDRAGRQVAFIRAKGWFGWHTACLAPGAALLWNFNERKLRP